MGAWKKIWAPNVIFEQETPGLQEAGERLPIG
jgi:hypothetical protein